MRVIERGRERRLVIDGQTQSVFFTDGDWSSALDDYWARASSKPHLHNIRVPALVVNARNDPFVPAWCLPLQSEVGAHVTLWQPEHGGHVGFPDGRFPGHVLSLPEQVTLWLQQCL